MKYLLFFLIFVTPILAVEKRYDATIISVYDGDTCTALITLPLDVSKTEKIRILGIDAPEMPTPEGIKSKDVLSRKILNQKVVIVTHGDVREKYGRLLADIIYKDLDIATFMKDVGAAKAYDGGKR